MWKSNFEFKMFKGFLRGVCLRQAKAVSIEGHPEPAYNSVYTHDSTHEGWPVLKNAHGRYCYRYNADRSLHVTSIGDDDDGEDGEDAPDDEYRWGQRWYRYNADRWHLASEHRPDAARSNGAYLVAKEGPLPVGTHAWKVPDDPGNQRDDIQWKDAMLTVALLVRLQKPCRVCLPRIA